MKPDRAYLLISGRLYLTTGDCSGTEPGNLYPCALGTPEWRPGQRPNRIAKVSHGDTLTLFGRSYQVNDLHQGGRNFVEDEIDLELVLLEDRPPMWEHDGSTPDERAEREASASLRRLDLESREEVDAVEPSPAMAGSPTGRILVYLAAGWWLGSLTSFHADNREQAAEILDRCHYIEQ